MDTPKKYGLFAGISTLVIALFIFEYIPFTKLQRLNRQCQDFGRDAIQKHKDMFEGTKVDFFYSKRLDTCVAESIDELGNDYSLCDIKRNYIKQELEDPTNCGGLFHCDKDGVDNVILAKAEKYKGNLFNVPYSNFLDNGESGEPRAIKTPEKPYSREKCETMFNQKRIEIK